MELIVEGYPSYVEEKTFSLVGLWADKDCSCCCSVAEYCLWIIQLSVYEHKPNHSTSPNSLVEEAQWQDCSHEFLNIAKWLVLYKSTFAATCSDHEFICGLNWRKLSGVDNLLFFIFVILFLRLQFTTKELCAYDLLTIHLSTLVIVLW